MARRRQIKDALLTVMARRGYESATVARIARTAGLSPGLVHYHFASKEQILLGLLRDLTVIAQARYARRSARAGADPRARLHAFIDAQLSLGDDADPRAAAAWAAIGAEASRHPRVGRVYRLALAASRRELQRLFAAAGPGFPRRAASAALAILTAIEGCFHLAFAAPGVLPPGSAAPMVRLLADDLLESS
jgi:TetR/AcrR family transcriptional repressor of bet genes